MTSVNTQSFNINDLIKKDYVLWKKNKKMTKERQSNRNNAWMGEILKSESWINYKCLDYKRRHKKTKTNKTRAINKDNKSEKVFLSHSEVMPHGRSKVVCVRSLGSFLVNRGTQYDLTLHIPAYDTQVKSFPKSIFSTPIKKSGNQK